ncbi:MAG: biotin/lipoyl-containing protein, partial [Acidobacteriaceae bacterium]
MVYEVKMPVLSQSMIQGRIVEWLLKEGDKVDKGAVLVVVESDKATHELEAAESGILQKILAEEGAEVDVDTPIAIIAHAGEPGAAPVTANSHQVPEATLAGVSMAAKPDVGGRR